MLFLDLTSDPSSSATERGLANNVLMHEFTPGVQNKRGSARSNKIFAAYQTQYLKATQLASAKASASRHLATSTGTGYGAGSSGSSGFTTPNPASKTQQKKEATEKKAATSAGKPAATGEKEGAAGSKSAWKKVDAGGNDGVDRRPKSAVSPHFDCTRHNVRAEWLKWRDLGASGQVLEWISHGVAVPWLTGAPPPPFNQGVSCRGLPRDQAVFLQEEIERLTLSGVLRPVEYSRWVSRAFLVSKPAGSGWRLIVDLEKIE